MQLIASVQAGAKAYLPRLPSLPQEEIAAAADADASPSAAASDVMYIS